jgi:putative oxidoreductase
MNTLTMNGAVPGSGARDVASLIGRILLAALFVQSGWAKITAFAGTAGYIASKGLPFSELLTAITILIELGGGLLIVVGWKARWAALAMIVFLLAITPIFHGYWSAPSDQVMNQYLNFWKNVSILGGMFVFFASGPGRFSIDRQ